MSIEVISFLISAHWVWFTHLVTAHWNVCVCVFVCAQLVTQLGGFEEVCHARKWSLLTKEVRNSKILYLYMAGYGYLS